MECGIMRVKYGDISHGKDAMLALEDEVGQLGNHRPT